MSGNAMRRTKAKGKLARPVGKACFTHDEPRLRDGERRVLADRPLRGGPLNRDANA